MTHIVTYKKLQEAATYREAAILLSKRSYYCHQIFCQRPSGSIYSLASQTKSVRLIIMIFNEKQQEIYMVTQKNLHEAATSMEAAIGI